MNKKEIEEGIEAFKDPQNIPEMLLNTLRQKVAQEIDNDKEVSGRVKRTLEIVREDVESFNPHIFKSLTYLTNISLNCIGLILNPSKESPELYEMAKEQLINTFNYYMTENGHTLMIVPLGMSEDEVKDLGVKVQEFGDIGRGN